MKNKIVILAIGLAAFGFGFWTGTIKKSVDEKFAIIDEAVEASNPSTKEDFNDFIYTFISDSLFQLDRIQFPLKTMRPDSEEVATIQKSDWKHVRLFWSEQYKAQLYDNFKRELRDTDERMFCWEGVENGINVQYWFKRIEGRWYLTAYYDLSD